ncbi:MAG: hypothetical protein IJV76_04575 [Clostridia bacterium]|nr:hypothetical protein [Clostridia bacterium]
MKKLLSILALISIVLLLPCTVSAHSVLTDAAVTVYGVHDPETPGEYIWTLETEKIERLVYHWASQSKADIVECSSDNTRIELGRTKEPGNYSFLLSAECSDGTSFSSRYTFTIAEETAELETPDTMPPVVSIGKSGMKAYLVATDGSKLKSCSYRWGSQYTGHMYHLDEEPKTTTLYAGRMEKAGLYTLTAYAQDLDGNHTARTKIFIVEKPTAMTVIAEVR